ncbi:phosphate signaling complex protein PhoU [Virgibacillus dakarensis]|uniref:Phosphate-specific transport system accessory protein PhoU n=1 Tax=Lentibacillus populi TaxID=1827502 RepID=A0A9W5TUL4_9BACI|nr:phosphate signaling complex protein PhoU [Lentibacillus populi]MTW84070.1 phosphate signaling complex protein PhoU [Virgibacillus dakarensis]GGB29277.1 phosphate transport system regulatory protein PhoU [Lentibacillus populi]
MAVREQFHNDLQRIKQAIIKLASATEEALCMSVDALFNQDVILANRIISQDKDIDKQEFSINDRVILLIAKQQPVAEDLRRLIIALRITNDLERMGDNAKNIAKAAIHLGEDHRLTIHEKIKNMRDIALEMLHTAMNAFEFEDISIAGKLSEMDDKMDETYEQVIKEMLEETTTNPEKTQYIMQMAFSARYMERFADHITNIGESILFLVKGESYKLN